MSPLLEIDGVSKSYGDTRALVEVSLRVDGGIVGLLGANGAGKSTLFRAILDLVPLDAGSIQVAGFHSRRESIEVRRRVGYLPEEPRYYERLSGVEFLELVAALKGLPDAVSGEALLDTLGLGEARRELIGEYSLGMRKKVGLAAALMGEPELVLLDEPLNGLDTESMRRLRLEIEAMAARGTSFLISSHVMAFVERICPRVVILKEGRVVADATPHELRRRTGLAGEPFEDVFLRLAL